MAPPDETLLATIAVLATIAIVIPLIVKWWPSRDWQMKRKPAVTQPSAAPTPKRGARPASQAPRTRLTTQAPAVQSARPIPGKPASQAAPARAANKATAKVASERKSPATRPIATTGRSRPPS